MASRRKSSSYKTTVVMYPKSTKGKVLPVKTVATDVNKAVNGNLIEKPTIALERAMEKKIAKEIQNKDVDLAVFKSVAEYMFRDPHFRTMIEERYGVQLGKGLGMYLRTVGFVLETIFGVWLVVAGPIRLTMRVTKFIFNVVFYACIVTVRWLDKVGYVPVWLSKRMKQTRTASKNLRTPVSNFTVVG